MFALNFICSSEINSCKLQGYKKLKNKQILCIETESNANILTNIKTVCLIVFEFRRLPVCNIKLVDCRLDFFLKISIINISTHSIALIHVNHHV